MIVINDQQNNKADFICPSHIVNLFMDYTIFLI